MSSIDVNDDDTDKAKLAQRVADMQTREAVYFVEQNNGQGDLFGDVSGDVKVVTLNADNYDHEKHGHLALYCKSCFEKHGEKVALRSGITRAYSREIEGQEIYFPAHFNAKAGDKHACSVRSVGRTQRIKNTVAELLVDFDKIKKIQLSIAGFSVSGGSGSGLGGQEKDSQSEDMSRADECHIAGIFRLIKLLQYTQHNLSLRDRLIVRGVPLSKFFNSNASSMSGDLKSDLVRDWNADGVYPRALTVKTVGDLSGRWVFKEDERVYAECLAHDNAGNQVRVQIEDLKALQKFQDIFGGVARFGLSEKQLFICSPAVYAGGKNDDSELAVIITHPRQFMEVEPGVEIR